MALHTAIGFIFISSALILSRPDQGYLSLIPKGSPGARSYARLPLAYAVTGRPQPIDVTVGVSVGIALSPGHARDLDSLVKVADSAMHRAKIDGKANGRFTNIEFAT